MKGMSPSSHWLIHKVCCRWTGGRPDKHTLPPCELYAGRPAQPPGVPAVSPVWSVLWLLCPHPGTLNRIWFEWFGEIKANSVHKPSTGFQKLIKFEVVKRLSPVSYRTENLNVMLRLFPGIHGLIIFGLQHIQLAQRCLLGCQRHILYRPDITYLSNG